MRQRPRDPNRRDGAVDFPHKQETTIIPFVCTTKTFNDIE